MTCGRYKEIPGTEAPTMATDRLKTELETYESCKNELVEKSEGRFVVIRGTEVLGTFGTYEDALQKGYEECGVQTPFLVKQISSVEQVHFITRELPACRS